ncbi:MULTISPECIES: STAS domain-containing protein [unclassified Streptomyces]|uniref:STAS domain-containing protein n=1 Tax=unclassified Streptomyces TaxID=2593676 RepID=UPI002253121E|nr:MULTISPECIES: STAS domain-containing protein [unclassified Streptomyces]MCX4524409.1 STAS domain-containing protein [Streptomyces sp. NBC_01551]MCX4545069.1 STAS domain-containing protein [Streptomyces sp. NBC_01565]
MTTTLIDLKTAVRSDGDVRGTLAGELDFHTARQVEPRLTALAAYGHRSLVLDLSGISFCDSAGIDLFLRVHHRCYSAGTRFRLCGVPPLVAKSMRVLGADRELRLVVA